MVWEEDKIQFRKNKKNSTALLKLRTIGKKGNIGVYNASNMAFSEKNYQIFNTSHKLILLFSTKSMVHIHLTVYQELSGIEIPVIDISQHF